MQYILFVALVPVAALILVVVGALAWLRRDTASASALLWLSLSTLGWLVFNTLELVSMSSSETLQWAKITYVFIALTPLMWLIFALQYAGWRVWLSLPRFALMAIVPLITILIALTNAVHGLLWREYHFVSVAGFLHMRPVAYGLWFWVHTLFAYGCVLLGAGVILSHYVQMARAYRRQARWVVVGALCPIVVNAAYVFRIVPGWTKDFSPLGLAVAGLFFAVSIFRHRLFDLQPVGRDQLVESMRDPVIVVDGQYRIVDANPATRRIVGAADAELVGQPLPETLPVVASLLSTSRRGDVFEEDVAIGMDGEERRYEVHLSDLEDGRGRLLGHLIVLHDVTERMETLMRLRRQERLAAVGQLAGGIAHDFNNLLGSITLHAQLAQRNVNQGPEAVEENLAVIVKESGRASDLVDQILDFSRSEAMESEPLDLGPFIQEVTSVLRRTIREDIRLVVETPSRPCIVEADPTQIQQILLNLATNARDAMPNGGDLRIAVERCQTVSEDGSASGAESQWARLTVSDTGTGMDERTQKHLFEPFFTTKEPDKGTGLGLAQVYGIVKRHGGRIDVQTAVGEGTTFTIHLPLVPSEDELREDDAREPPVPGDGETILVVEDAERFRRGIQQGLESLNYRVVTAANGREALDVVSADAVDLALTDLIMPEMGGEALLRRLEERAPHLPVIAMTGFVGDGDIDELPDAGFAAAIAKPFSIQDLGAVVHDALNRRGADG